MEGRELCAATKFSSTSERSQTSRHCPGSPKSLRSLMSSYWILMSCRSICRSWEAATLHSSWRRRCAGSAAGSRSARGNERILGGEDPDIAETILKLLQDEGIEFITSAHVDRVSGRSGAIVTRHDRRDGEDHRGFAFVGCRGQSAKHERYRARARRNRADPLPGRLCERERQAGDHRSRRVGDGRLCRKPAFTHMAFLGFTALVPRAGELLPPVQIAETPKPPRTQISRPPPLVWPMPSFLRTSAGTENCASSDSWTQIRLVNRPFTNCGTSSPSLGP